MVIPYIVSMDSLSYMGSDEGVERVWDEIVDLGEVHVGKCNF
jgi:hypothetical protein